MREIAGRGDLRDEEAWALVLDYLAADDLAWGAPAGEGPLTGTFAGSPSRFLGFPLTLSVSRGLSRAVRWFDKLTMSFNSDAELPRRRTVR